ncbi:MAG: N-acetylmuramoyl-L-alanine amidase [Thermosynechococcaceae cyanobacterium MS004]|nr:N-acetylmuramoyl-L-alanine amidase [Thermosynechococcaceae cyanobacterium MS004]
MSKFGLFGLAWALVVVQPVFAEEVLKVVYPPQNHETTANQIFLIGTASPNTEVTVNGQVIRDRSPGGHFSPSLPLQIGDNTFTLRSGTQTLTLTVRRKSTTLVLPSTLGFAEGSLTPKVDIARLPQDPVCFSAIATPNAQVSVRLGNQVLALVPQTQAALPPNSAVLTAANQPITAQPGLYQGCTKFSDVKPTVLGKPVFEVRQGNALVSQPGTGQVEILSPQTQSSIEVTSAQGVARTGPSTDFSRLTPLPKGTQASVTGREGEWLRLDYGGWIKQGETRPISTTQTQSLIRSVRVQTLGDRTRILFPLQSPVPVTVQQRPGTVTLTLHNTIAQTDTILQTPDAVLSRLDWQQVAPNRIEYQIQLKTQQQWGYALNYEGTSLVLSLRHPPKLTARSSSSKTSLSGTTILLDPGHGSSNDLGALGPTGYPEKDVTLIVSKLLRTELEQRGAKVIMTREGEDDLYPNDRVAKIEQTSPTLALSLHYNALPDAGDAWKTQGISTYWYHPQAQNLAVFLHDYLTQKLQRPSYGVYWNNLALTRPAIAPSVLLELGFMINPQEFEWITNPQAQRRLAATLADGITAWFHQP